MRRLLPALLLLVLTACSSGDATPAPTTTPSLPKGELAVLVDRITAARATQRTFRFHTESFASDGAATEARTIADGHTREGPDGVGTSLSMTVSAGAGDQRIDMVLVGDDAYVHMDGAPMPEGKRWAFYDQGQTETGIAALLRGFGPRARPGSELDYAEPRAALVVGRAEEPLDGVPTTRYELVVDPMKMAKVIADPDVQLQHTQLAEHGVTIAATVWVEAGGLPLKVDYRFTLDGKVVKRSTTTFADWGRPVDLTVPSAQETVPADQLPK
ncbi:hypothetical protein GCM10022243_35220 [Saccharothrix violaceirubra]|uniref:Lipoprotein LprG n=1 Tax=Saccharothrix violaceirubra TaxID=413306 RepID=A0A7W7SZV6_9PSEU|nr:hypothetical protein [Saccharothrix violaceirubra]MBB4963895.1 hypothetical protein [Saccharothrix violaceirubra]